MRGKHSLRENQAAAESSIGRRVVVIGGGFGGLEATHKLSKLLKGSDDEVILISASNYLLFTSMLPEVASGMVRPEHICAPARAYAPGARFINGEVVDIDTLNHLVIYRHAADGAYETLAYDHLVMATGSVANFFGMEHLRQHAFAMKSLDDAIAVRNHIIGMLERADAEEYPARRKQFLTFVVAGGGIAGVETVAELRDLVFGALRYYPSISPDELSFVVVEMRDRILPEIEPNLADYAQRKLEKRGIEFRLGERIIDAGADYVNLTDGSKLPTRTLIWTTGNQPNPLAELINGERDENGRLITDECMRVLGVDGVWAIGDIARIPDVLGEREFHPPTAQHAHRQGKRLAHNVSAVLRGKQPEPFRFRSLGTLVSLGHRSAVAEIRGLRFSGFLAWWMWRTVYLSKMPTLLKKIRVVLDWTIALFFPRDIVKTRDARKAPETIDPETSGGARAA